MPVAELSAKARDVLTNANATFERIDRILAAAPIDQTLRKIDSASTRLDALLADPGLKQTVDNVAAISARVRKLADNGDLDRMVKRIDDTAERLDALIGDNQYDVRVIVQDLRVTADNLRVLSETVKRYPAGALVGGPPEKVQLPGNSQMSAKRVAPGSVRCPDASPPARSANRSRRRRHTSWIRRWPRPASPAARRPETLRMGNVRVAAAYAGNALVYRMDDVQYTSDPYHAFIAEPGAMLGNRMAEWLDRAGPFKTVAQPGSARPARVRARGYGHRALRRFPRGTSPRGGAGRAVRADRPGRRASAGWCANARSPAASISRRHRPTRWCAGTARRWRKSSRSSFPSSAPRTANRRRRLTSRRVRFSGARRAAKGRLEPFG